MGSSVNPTATASGGAAVVLGAENVSDRSIPRTEDVDVEHQGAMDGVVHYQSNAFRLQQMALSTTSRCAVSCRAGLGRTSFINSSRPWICSLVAE